nr:putative clathrin assembly protein [Quercus suber]
MVILVDRFMEQEVHDCVKIYEMFCRVCKQFEELDLFYGWCKGIGYTKIEKITPKKLEVMGGRQRGEAKTNWVVIVALYPIVKESFQIYYDIAEIMVILVDRFMEQEVHDCVKIYEMFCRVCKQFEELDLFYGWCKGIGYTKIEKITPKKLEVMGGRQRVCRYSSLMLSLGIMHCKGE